MTEGIVNLPSASVEAHLRVPSIITFTPGIVSPVARSLTTPFIVPVTVCGKTGNGRMAVIRKSRIMILIFITDG